MNVETARESRQTRDSSEGKLSSAIFMKLCQIKGTPEMDLFASRVSHQFPQYISWKIDPISQGKHAFQISWAHKFVYAFPPFPPFGSSESKSGSVFNAHNNPSMARPTIVSRASKSVCKKPTTSTSTPLVIQNSPRLIAWTISGRTYLQKEYQKGLPTLSQTIGEHLQSSIKSQFGRSDVAGVLNGRYLPLDRI